MVELAKTHDLNIYEYLKFLLPFCQSTEATGRIGTQKDGIALVIGAIPPNLKLLPSNRKHLILLVFFAKRFHRRDCRYICFYIPTNPSTTLYSYDLPLLFFP